MIVDAHVHLTPPGMLEEFAEHDDEPYWQFLTTPDGRNAAEQILVDGEQMIAAMDAAGVDAVVLQAGYLQSVRGRDAKNAAVLELARRFAGRVWPFVALDPASPAATDSLDRLLDAGAIGVGEVNPYAHGVRLDDPRFLALAGWCEERGVPMTLHMSEEAGRFYFGRSTYRLADYLTFATTFPGLPLVLAHWGGGLFFYEIMPVVADQLRHVRYDTAASPLLYPTPRVVRVAAEALAPEKILFGSDFPLRLYRDQDGADMTRWLGELDPVLTESFGVHGRDLVLGGNAERLLSGAVASVRTRRTDGVVHETTTQLADRLELPVDPFMSVAAVARRYPATREVFERFGLPWQDSPVPVWEPIVQSAAARGLGRAAQGALVEELNRAVRS